MPHPVAELIKKACLENWCCEVGCTTCGCMPFRGAIRDMGAAVVDEWFRLPDDPELRALPNFGRFWHLIAFHQLPRTAEEAERSREEFRKAWAEAELRWRAEEAAERLRVEERRALTRAANAEKHLQRQMEGDWRRQDRAELLTKPIQDRLRSMVRMENLTYSFFGINPDEVTDEMIRDMDGDFRRALIQRIARGRHPASWRALARRLQAHSPV